MKFSRFLPVLASSLFVSTAAVAAPPLSTLTADVPGTGACNADFGYSDVRLRGPGFKASEDAFGLGLACGVAKTVELGADYLHVDGRNYGLGLTGKWQFWTNAQGGALALTGRVDTARFGGSDGLEYVGSTLGLAYTQRWGQHEVHANANLLVPDQGDNAAGVAVAYGYQFAPAWTALAEVGKVEDSAAVWGAGLRWQASRDWQLGLLLNQSKDAGVRARETRLTARLAF